MLPSLKPSPYVGRLAPSPTGYLHLGHARTFSIAAERAKASGGKLLLRIDDLDRERCRPEFTEAAIEALRLLGLHWEGPPLLQSQRLAHYRRALERLHAAELIYPCTKTRKEIREAAAAQSSVSEHSRSGCVRKAAPNERADDAEQDPEPLYPPHFRPTQFDAAATTLRKKKATEWLCDRLFCGELGEHGFAA